MVSVRLLRGLTIFSIQAFVIFQRRFQSAFDKFDIFFWCGKAVFGFLLKAVQYVHCRLKTHCVHHAKRITGILYQFVDAAAAPIAHKGYRSVTAPLVAGPTSFMYFAIRPRV